jgi:hypothetical protein
MKQKFEWRVNSEYVFWRAIHGRPRAGSPDFG